MLPKFVHRADYEGQIVSFCAVCFQTVAVSSKDTVDLQRSEQEHVCDPQIVARLNREISPSAVISTESKYMASS